MCIYYNQFEGLNYDTQEHIIPAGIGGITKLPNGYVSDEFNREISKLEADLLQSGIIKIPREIIGPGKRGKLNKKFAKKSSIYLIETKRQEDPFAIGFIQLGIGYEIPHILLNLESGKCILSIPKEDIEISGGGQQAAEKFRDRCLTPETLTIKTIHEKKLPKEFILFGVKDGLVHNFNAFYVVNPDCSFQIKPDFLKKMAEGLNTTSYHATEYKPVVNTKMVFKIEHLRVFAKMAFNYLAHIKGAEYVKQEQFDEIRSWIAYGKGQPQATLVRPNEILTTLGIKDQHTIIIFKVDNSLIANVNTFGNFSFNIILSKDFTEAFVDPDIGFICDWENRNDLSIAKYLAERFKA